MLRLECPVSALNCASRCTNGCTAAVLSTAVPFVSTRFGDSGTMRNLTFVATTTAVVALAATRVSAQVVYSNSFNTDNHGFGGNTQVWTTPNDCQFEFCGKYLGASGSAVDYRGGGAGRTFANDNTATLTLNGLGAHTGGMLLFKLFVIDSWDGNGGMGPDRFQVTINGNNAFDASFADPQFAASRTQSFGSQFDGGATKNAPGTGAAQNSQLGAWFWLGEVFDDGEAEDGSVYEILVPFTDEASNLVIGFHGHTDNQGMFDESWGLDDVKVTLNPGDVVGTPEPASIGLVATGLIGIGAFARRKRRAKG